MSGSIYIYKHGIYQKSKDKQSTPGTSQILFKNCQITVLLTLKQINKMGIKVKLRTKPLSRSEFNEKFLRLTEFADEVSDPIDRQANENIIELKEYLTRYKEHLKMIGKY